jgi:uncharacterized protein YodC (DUF2158 family)
MVHYVLREEDLHSSHVRCAGEVVPAIVVRVWEGREDGYSNLTIFPDWSNHGLSGMEWKTSVVNDETGKPGTWHWPKKTSELPADLIVPQEDIVAVPVDVPSTTQVVELPPGSLDDVPADPFGIGQGDLVRLKSGGPVMTVGEVIADRANVSWFDESHALQRDSFSLAVLEAVPPITPQPGIAVVVPNDCDVIPVPDDSPAVDNSTLPQTLPIDTTAPVVAPDKPFVPLETSQGESVPAVVVTPEGQSTVPPDSPMGQELEKIKAETPADVLADKPADTVSEIQPSPSADTGAVQEQATGGEGATVAKSEDQTPPADSQVAPESTPEQKTDTNPAPAAEKPPEGQQDAPPTPPSDANQGS